MLLLIIAVIIFVSIFVIFRLFSKYNINNLQAIVVNYLTAAFVSYFFAKDASDLNAILDRAWITPAFYLGSLFMVSFLVFAHSTQKSGVAITAVASKMSVVIPVLFGIYFYENEFFSYYILAGLILALASFFFIFKTKEKIEFNTKLLIFPILLFFLNGSSDSLMKYIRQIFLPIENTSLNEEIIFVGVLFSSSFLIGAVILFISQIYSRRKFELKSILAGIILGIFNFFSALMLFKAMGNFSSAFFFPVFNIGVVGLSALVGQFIFKENLSKTNWIGIILAILTIALLTLV